jgi:hypothetical protein
MRLLLPLLACCLLTAAEPDPAVPATAAASATAAALRAAEAVGARQAFFTWALGGAYRRAGGADDSAEARFLDHLAKHLVSNGRNPSPDQMRSEARALLAANTPDPLVRLRCAILLNDAARAGACATALRERAGTPAAYPALHLSSALYRQLRLPDKAAAARANAELPAVAAAATDEVFAAAPAPRAMLIDRLVDWQRRLCERDGLDQAGRERLLALLGEPGRDQVLARTLVGVAAIDDAWRARGSGWASSVTEEGWKGFRAGLEKARRELTAAHEQLPAAPAPAAYMITVAMGDGRRDTQDWFARALAADPGCEEAWQRMRNATLPRWGGSTAKLLALARRATALAAPGNQLANRAEETLSAYVSEGGAEPSAWKVIAQLDAVCPPEDAAARAVRRLGAAWNSGRREEAFALYTALGGLSASSAAVAAVPFSPPTGGRLLLLRLERARLGLDEWTVQPLPAGGHAQAGREPGISALMPGWWQAHGRRDPAWDARLAALLDQRAAGTGPSTAGALVAAGCSDPLVRYLACDERRDPAARRAELRACWEALAEAGYPPLAVWQPAWFLMQDLLRDKQAAAERAAMTPRFAALATALAASVGAEGATAGLVACELGSPPGDDPAVLALLERAAAAPGIDSGVADAVAGLVALQRSRRAAAHSAERSRLAWTAITRLWPAWTATGHPRLAVALATATCLADLPSAQARCWFDQAVRKAYDDNSVWHGLAEGFALAGRPDDLLAFAEDIARLPASPVQAARALDPLLSVVSNRYLHDRERLTKAWAVGGKASAVLLATPGLAPERRIHWLHVRLGLAALAGEQDAAARAAKDLGASYDPKRLPAGVEPAQVEPFLAAAAGGEQVPF